MVTGGQGHLSCRGHVREESKALGTSFQHVAELLAAGWGLGQGIQETHGEGGAGDRVFSKKTCLCFISRCDPPASI